MSDDWPTDPAALRRRLEERFSSSAAMGETLGSDGEGVFPDGSPVAVCTSWARAVERTLGSDRCRVVGFLSDAVPSSRIARDHGGHDFAVVDGRWIVDGWACDVEGYLDGPVLDLEEPDEARRAVELFGAPDEWPGVPSPIGEVVPRVSDADRETGTSEPTSFPSPC